MSSYYDDSLDPLSGVPKNKTAPRQFLNNPPSNFPVTAFGTQTGATPYTGPTGYGGPGGQSFLTEGIGAGGAQGGSYQDIIQNDPAYSQLLKDLSAQGISDDAGARAAGQRGFIQFGEVPEGLDPSGWGDATTRELARKNTEAGFSSTARLGKQFQDQLRAIKRVLASRGALQSGEYGHQLAEEQGRYATGQYDSRQKLTDYISAIHQGLAAARRQAALAQAGGLSDAANRAVAGGYNPGWGAPAGAPAPAAVAPNPETGMPQPPGPVSPGYYSNEPGTPGYRKPLLDPYGNGF